MQRFTIRWMCATIVVWAMPAIPSQTIDNFLDGSKLQEIRLTMNPADWVMLKQNYLADTNYRCDFEWQGIVVKNSGVKSRGSNTRNPTKPSLTIDFTKYSPLQRFLGLRSVVLRNFAQDASMMHERLTMEMFQRLGLPYEREAHAKVFINDVYVGLFLAVEPIDERFTQTRFGETDGYLYEYKWNGQSFYFNYLGDDPALYVPGLFEAKNNESAPQPEAIRDMVKAANFSTDADFPAVMQQYLDLGSFMTHVAAEQFMAEGDGMMNPDGMRNFYLYRRVVDNRFVFLVWDKDWTFSLADFDIFRGTDLNILTRRSLAVPALRQRYLEELLEAAQIAGGPGGWLEQEVIRVTDQIRTAVEEDPSRACLIGDAGIQPCPLSRFEAQVVWITNFAEQRSEFVKESVAAQGVSIPFPMLMPGNATNDASLVPQLVAGSLARVVVPLSISEVKASSQLPMPLELAGVSVRIADQAAPIASVSPAGVVVQVPWEVICGPTSLVVQDQGSITNTISVETRPASPGIFAVTHADGTLVDTDHPAAPGEVVVVYATGLGAALFTQITGYLPSGGAVGLQNEVTAWVGGLPATVQWAGLSAQFLGWQQVNLEIPTSVMSAGTVTLQLVLYDELGAPYALAVRPADQ